jgi:hypothetical protein
MTGGHEGRRSAERGARPRVSGKSEIMYARPAVERFGTVRELTLVAGATATDICVSPSVNSTICTRGS